MVSRCFILFRVELRLDAGWCGVDRPRACPLATSVPAWTSHQTTVMDIGFGHDRRSAWGAARPCVPPPPCTLSLGKANSPSLTAEFPAQEKTKSTSLKIETLSQYIYVTNEGNLGRSIYMLKLAQAESDFGLKSQHDDTSQKTNLKTNPKVKL